ncbi:MAG: transcriptional regulator [Bacteroidetes bacterium CG18_big_fil_WC_8_21_14_2_50_41_14]|nr:MAG: transcriptional regulator [Bacteroidetes bacterium CG18_big_fil_WC_8_21_14_2_50_41_14]PJB55363.1 MAG: XRE family transcriptional regulator [Bacteroidetes bacterium CG_4_9_14_3_um_filter_41_19]
MGVDYTKEEKNFLERIGNRIRELRIKADLSQEKFAFACNLDRTYIGSVERGERNISALNLRKIAKALNISTSDLLNMNKEQGI